MKAIRDIGKHGFHPEIEQYLRPFRIVYGIGQQRIARPADLGYHGRAKPLLVCMDRHAAQSARQYYASSLECGGTGCPARCAAPDPARRRGRRAESSISAGAPDQRAKSERATQPPPLPSPLLFRARPSARHSRRDRVRRGASKPLPALARAPRRRTSETICPRHGVGPRRATARLPCRVRRSCAPAGCREAEPAGCRR